MQSPLIVSISRLHRRTSEVVCQAENEDRPLFVTQYAFVVAVLLPRAVYDRLLRAAGSVPVSVAESAPVTAPPAMHPDTSGPAESGPLESPLAVFGPLPRGTQFMTRLGFPVDAAMAAWIMEDGGEVRPILQQRSDTEGDELAVREDGRRPYQ
jgi:hypothetical protein